MLFYYLKYKITYKVKIERIIFLSKCEVCDSKKLKLIKEKETSRLLSRLEINTRLSKTTLVVPLFFQVLTSLYKI